MCIHYSCTLPMHVIMYWITGDYTRDPLLSLWLKPTRPWPSLSQSLMRESMWTSTMRPSRPSSRVVYGPSRSPWGGSRYFNFCPHRWHSAVVVTLLIKLKSVDTAITSSLKFIINTVLIDFKSLKDKCLWAKMICRFESENYCDES